MIPKILRRENETKTVFFQTKMTQFSLSLFKNQSNSDRRRSGPERPAAVPKPSHHQPEPGTSGAHRGDMNRDSGIAAAAAAEGKQHWSPRERDEPTRLKNRGF